MASKFAMPRLRHVTGLRATGRVKAWGLNRGLVLVRPNQPVDGDEQQLQHQEGEDEPRRVQKHAPIAKLENVEDGYGYQLL